MIENQPPHFGHFRVATRPDGSPVELGRGAMGVTYKAHDERLRMDVALKVITPSQTENAKAQGLFLREARAAARVHQTNVATVVYLNDTPGNIFYAMEFVEGQPLKEWLEGRLPLAPLVAISIAMQIARGLEAIHEQDIVHRDLKPANVMMVRARPADATGRTDANAEPWRVKIIDFGLARAFAGEGVNDPTMTHTIGFRGTALYASPEQAEERPDIDGRSDLYSLGCILWEMLCGAPPFRGTTHRELINKHISETVPVERLAHLPASVAAVVARLMIKDPANRFANAASVVKALERCRERLESGEEKPVEVGATTMESHAGRTPAGEASALAAAIQSPRTPSRRNVFAAITALLALSVASWFVFRSTTTEPKPAGPAGPGATALGASPVPSPALKAPRKSVAVLPFSNLSADKENEYFADGVQDDVLLNLAKIRDLKVISRTSVMEYRGRTQNLKKIAAELGVTTVVEGSVRRAGNRVRVVVQLIDANTDEHLWADNYEGDLTDVFAIQSKIAGDIARTLAVQLTPQEQRAIEQVPTQNLVAYELYRQFLSRVSPWVDDQKSLLEAITLLDQAIVLDPTFLLAYCARAQVHDYMFFFNFDATPTRLALAEESLREARRLAPEAGETHLAQGLHFYRGYRAYDRAAAEIAAAMWKLPNHAEAYFALGTIDRRRGRWVESVQSYERAFELDPRNLRMTVALYVTNFLMRRYPECIPPLDRQIRHAENQKEPTARLKMERAFVNYAAAADAKPLHDFYATHGDSAEDYQHIITVLRFILAINERDRDTALRALASIRKGAVEGFINTIFGDYPVGWFAGSLARRFGDEAAAVVAFEEARAQAKQRVQNRPGAFYDMAILARIDAALGRKDEAIAEARRAVEILPISVDTMEGVALVTSLAMVYAAVGEKDRALEQLELVTSIPAGPSYGELRLESDWDSLRGDPRFEVILARLAPAPGAKF